MSKALSKILENPPYEKVYCSWCGGSGITNLRGYRQSNTCKECHGDRDGKSVIDYDEWCKQVIALSEKENDHEVQKP